MMVSKYNGLVTETAVLVFRPRSRKTLSYEQLWIIYG
jgi:hypothetical protein